MDCFVAALLAMTEHASPQMLLEKLRRPAPGQLSALAVMHGDALLVHEGMFRIVAEELERLAGGLHRLLESIDRGRCAPIVLVGEMRLQRDLHIGRLCRLLRRNAVEHDTR